MVCTSRGVILFLRKKTEARDSKYSLPQIMDVSQNQDLNSELQLCSSVFGQVDSLIVFNQINTALFFKSLNSTKELREKKQASPIPNSAPLVPVPRDNPFHQFVFLVLLVVFSLILNNIICWLTNFFFFCHAMWMTYRLWTISTNHLLKDKEFTYLCYPSPFLLLP